MRSPRSRVPIPAQPRSRRAAEQSGEGLDEVAAIDLTKDSAAFEGS
jgi:hypothetical protein